MSLFGSPEMEHAVLKESEAAVRELVQVSQKDLQFQLIEMHPHK